MTVEIGMSSVFDVADERNCVVRVDQRYNPPRDFHLPLSGFHTNQAAIELTFRE